MSDHLSFIPPHSSVTLLQPGRCSQTIKLISCLMCQQSPGLLFVWMNHCFVKKILGSCQLFWQAGLSTYAQWRGRPDAPPHSNIQLCELQAFIKGKLATDSASLMFSGSCPNMTLSISDFSLFESFHSFSISTLPLKLPREIYFYSLSVSAKLIKTKNTQTFCYQTNLHARTHQLLMKSVRESRAT